MELDKYEKITQQADDLCFPVTIKIITDHLCEKHKKPRMKLSVKKIARLSRYKRIFGVFDTDYAIINLNAKHFKKYGYLIKEKSGIASDMKLLETILKDGNCSAPIVSVDSEYFTEQKKNYEVPEKPDYVHQLIIRKIDKNNNIVQIVDTLEPYILKSSNVQVIKTDLSLTNFIRYWEKAKKSVIWLERQRPDSSLRPDQKNLANLLNKGDTN